MTDDCRELLVSGLAELELPAENAHVEALLTFIGLLQKWNKAYNLTAIKNPADMVRLHLLDSLAVIRHLRGPRVLDAGCGAGLPGIPLAVFRPEMQFVLLDGNAKKTRFVQQAVLELRLKNIQVWNGRIENYRPAEPFDSIISRAFTNLGGFIAVSERLLKQDGSLLAMKGRLPEDELKQVFWNVKVIPLRVPGVDAERCLVQLSK